MDGPITPDAMEAVRKDFGRYIYSNNITRSQVAKAIGYSESVLSQWTLGKYPGDNDELTRAINDWMEGDARKRRVALTVEYVPTAVAEGMRNAVKIAHDRGKMAACIMPSGSGKSMMLDILRREMRGWLVYCYASMTPRIFWQAVAKAVGVALPGMRRDAPCGEIIAPIIDRLRGSRQPLLIDEAHLLPKKIFGDIRGLHDQTGVTIVLAGTEDIISRIDDRAGGRGQMARRCLVYNALAYYLNIDDPGRSTLGRPLFSKEEIRGYLDAMKVRVDPDAFQMLWAIACMPDRGCLGLVNDLVGTIIKILRQPRVTRQNIAQALELYDITARQRILNNAKQFENVLHQAQSAVA